MTFSSRLALTALAAAAFTITPGTAFAQGKSMTATTTPAASDSIGVPLIPREALFGNPTKSGGQISPDGKWLSWMAPWNGVLNVYIAPASNPDAAKRITNITDRPPGAYFWAPDGKSVLYVQDKGGDENYLLYGVDVASGKETKLTPFEKTRVQLVGGSTIQKDKLLLGLNNRDPRAHDVHLLDLKIGRAHV